MTPVFQTKYDPPHGNCFAACVATILDKDLHDVDVDVASCANLASLLARIEDKAKCKIYRLQHEAVVDRVVKPTERYCVLSVCSCLFNDDLAHTNSTWHAVVCEIAEGGNLSLVFNPNSHDSRTKSLEQFNGNGTLYLVKSVAG